MHTNLQQKELSTGNYKISIFSYPVSFSGLTPAFFLTMGSGKLTLIF
jgi:hypothetical protein